MLVGREKELHLLHDIQNDDSSHFVAVYGRRRVGKTFLIREAFGYRFAFQHAGLSEGGMKEQIYAFTSSLKDAGYHVKKQPKNWLEAFEALKDVIRLSSEKKKIIFIDELSWMDTQKSDLMVALENFWNGFASARKDIVLIVCASATSWMLSKVVHNKGGLYNRLTEQIHLRTFCLRECEAYVKAAGLALNRNQILQYYMIFGGVPYYWGFLKKGLSLSQNIDSILFEKDAPLRDEFKYLYAFGMKKKNAIYQLMDCFTLFYFKFLKSEPTGEHFWTNQINTPAVNTWLGLAFERVCMEHVDQIKFKLGISGVLTEVNSWYCKSDPDNGIFGSQIDMLIARKDQVINLCEMKYSQSEYTITEKVDRNIRNKISELRVVSGTKYAIYPTLITTYGVVENSYSQEMQSVVTMDDLFA